MKQRPNTLRSPRSQNPHLRRRHRRDRLFKRFGRGIAFLALGFLVFFIGGLIYWAWDGFTRYEACLEFPKSALIDGAGRPKAPRQAMVSFLTQQDLAERDLERLFAPSWHQRLHQVSHSLTVPAGADPGADLIKVFLPLEDAFDKALKKGGGALLSPPQTLLVQQLSDRGALVKVFRFDFFTRSDSRDPQSAGIFAGLISTLFLFCITLGLSFPLAILAALYLEEFARPSRLTRLIEVNIANLASVPSVVFGILGLAVFINFFGLPRSSSLVGGMTLSLMTLPTLVVASRSAIKAVPKSIRQAAQGMGASDMQIVLHHVFPIALPGIITGTIIALARSLGETAPLLMVGMMAFIVDVPQSLMDPAAPLPVQIFSWVRSPEEGFLANASAAILVLLLFLGALNTLAIYLRGKYEHKW